MENIKNIIKIWMIKMNDQEFDELRGFYIAKNQDGESAENKYIKKIADHLYNFILKENNPKKYPQILHVFDQPGLAKGEVMVAMQYEEDGKVEVDILMKDGQFPSEKAIEISRALNNNK